MLEITAPAILGEGYPALLAMMVKHGFADNVAVRAHMLDVALKRAQLNGNTSLWTDTAHQGQSDLLEKAHDGEQKRTDQ